MGKTVRTFLPLLLLLTLCSAGSIAAAAASAVPPMVAAGSGVNLGITRLLAEAFQKTHPNAVVQVPGSIGTRGAIKAAADGAIALGLISRPLQPGELALGFTAVPYARVPLALAVHPSVPDRGISAAELIDIVRGTKKRWKDGREIVVQVREKSDSGFGVLQEKIPGFREAYQQSLQTGRWSVYYTDQEANQAIVRTPCAIGVTDLGMIRTEGLAVKPLTLDGVTPVPEALAKGTYPLGRDLTFIYREPHLPKQGKAFLDFVRSEQGGRILKANGYLPLR